MTKVLKRQGDVLLERLGDDVPITGETKVITDRVIARGETTGHAHVLEGGELLETNRGTLAVVREEGAKVVHDEHDELEIEPGVWLIRHQIEYGGDGQNVAVYD